jgi:hypothetical protein
MIVKDNQPQLKEDIELVFTMPPAVTAKHVRYGGHGPGRIETRTSPE